MAMPRRCLAAPAACFLAVCEELRGRDLEGGLVTGGFWGEQVHLDSICNNELADPDELVSSDQTMSALDHRCCPLDRSLADWSAPVHPFLSSAC
jgi:hypothetical protein